MFVIASTAGALPFGCTANVRPSFSFGLIVKSSGIDFFDLRTFFLELSTPSVAMVAMLSC